MRCGSRLAGEPLPGLKGTPQVFGETVPDPGLLRADAESQVDRLMRHRTQHEPPGLVDRAEQRAWLESTLH